MYTSVACDSSSIEIRSLSEAVNCESGVGIVSLSSFDISYNKSWSAILLDNE